VKYHSTLLLPQLDGVEEELREERYIQPLYVFS
jgi:hypothetical protein